MITSRLAQPGQVQPRRYLGSWRVCQDVPPQHAEMDSQRDYGKLTSVPAPLLAPAQGVSRGYGWPELAHRAAGVTPGADVQRVPDSVVDFRCVKTCGYSRP